MDGKLIQWRTRELEKKLFFKRHGEKKNIGSKCEELHYIETLWIIVVPLYNYSYTIISKLNFTLFLRNFLFFFDWLGPYYPWYYKTWHKLNIEHIMINYDVFLI